MSASSASDQLPISHFRLLLWLKFRLIYMSFRRDKAKIVGTIIMTLVFVPTSIFFAVQLYDFAHAAPALAHIVVRDILTIAFLFWLISPLVGFSLNESYDPTRLFVYPVRYQTIFAANLVGSLLEGSTLLFVPILLALLLATTTTPLSLVLAAISLVMFMLLTIALGQIVTLTLIGFLRSRRFRDIMIVFFPLLAMLRFFFIHQNGRYVDPMHFFVLPAWQIADYFPPGWAATSLTSAVSGVWTRAFGFLVLLAAGTALCVFAASTVLKQLYLGDRGTSLPKARTQVALDRAQPAAIKHGVTASGIWLPIMTIAGKEWQYLVRDPQYKALGAQMIYFIALMAYYVIHPAVPHPSNLLNNPFAPLLNSLMPIALVVLLLFASSRLIFNIFGGEGPAITVLFSFPVERRLIVMGKNVAHGSIVIVIAVAALFGLCAFRHDFSSLTVSVSFLLMALAIVLAAGNLVSIRFPSKLIIRGSRFSGAGQQRIGASTSAGNGCVYSLLYLAATSAALVVEIPAAACVIIPALDPTYTVWYFLSIPLGLLYAAGVYYASLMIVNSWMLDHEQNIIQKLAPSD